jgi:hypothetical protein
MAAIPVERRNGLWWQRGHLPQNRQSSPLLIDPADRECKYRRAAPLILAICKGGHSCVGLSVVAEGVETLATMEALRGLGRDVAQGCYFARPQDAVSSLT